MSTREWIVELENAQEAQETFEEVDDVLFEIACEAIKTVRVNGQFHDLTHQQIGGVSRYLLLTA